MLNVLTITGRLAAAPEIRATQTGVPVTSNRIAVDRNFLTNGERETDFFEIVAWRGTAEFICKNFRKGRPITLVGRIQNREWTDKEKQKRVTTEIIVEQAFFGDSKPKDNSATGGNDYNSYDDNDDLPFASNPAENHGGWSPLG